MLISFTCRFEIIFPVRLYVLGFPIFTKEDCFAHVVELLRIWDWEPRGIARWSGTGNFAVADFGDAELNDTDI